MRNNLFPLLIILFIGVIILFLAFKLFFWVIVLAFKYWYIILFMVFLFWIIGKMLKGKREEKVKDYIETQYRVVEDQPDEQKHK